MPYAAGARARERPVSHDAPNHDKSNHDKSNHDEPNHDEPREAVPPDAASARARRQAGSGGRGLKSALECHRVGRRDGDAFGGERRLDVGG